VTAAAATGPRRIALPYVPALDGVRGIAVAAVLLFHGGNLVGGYLGVDLFFVLSGFLITSLLLVEGGREGRIDLAHFWARRARRLFPALAGMLAGVALYSAVLAPRADLAQIRAEAWATMLYVPNWYAVFAERDYWAQFRAPSPLQHTWSLGIEEQFYLVWPLVFAGLLAWLAKRARWAVLFGSLLLAAASSAWMWISYDPRDPSRVYYGTDTRAAAILLGGALAATQPLWGAVRSRWARAGIELAGIAALAGLSAAWWSLAGDAPVLYRGGFALCSAAGAALIGAAVCEPRGPLARMLAWAPLRGLGKISYGVYLWHWPVYLVLDPVRTGRSGWALTGARAGATLLVALASYAIVERPILRGALRGRQWAVIAPAVTAALVAAIAAATGGARSASPSGPPRIAGAPNAANGGGASLRVLILGDSVGVSLSPGLARAGPDHGLAFTLGVKVGCEPGDAKPDCPPPWPAQVARERPDIVLVTETGGWTLYPLRIDARVAAIGSPGWDEAWIQERQAIADGLFAAGAKQIVYTTLACFEPAWWQHEPRLSPANLARANADLAILAARNSGRVSLIDLAGYVCPDNRYRRDLGAVAVVRVDGIHYSADGADLVGRWLAQEIARAARAGR